MTMPERQPGVLHHLPGIIGAAAWALWIGGLAALFLFVQTLFETDRELAIEAAPVLFQVFERYQLILAVVCLGGFGLMAVMLRSRLTILLLCLVLIAAVLAVISALMITPRLEALRLEGRGASPEFRQLHGRSMLVYSATAAVLLIAGILLPLIYRGALLRRSQAPAAAAGPTPAPRGTRE